MNHNTDDNTRMDESLLLDRSRRRSLLRRNAVQADRSSFTPLADEVCGNVVVDHDDDAKPNKLPAPRRRLSGSIRRGSSTLSSLDNKENMELSSLMLRRGSSTNNSRRGDSLSSPHASFSNVNQEVHIVQSSLENQRQSKLSAALTSINKLKFESLGLIGRRGETLALQECLKRLCDDDKKKDGGIKRRELILLHGPSGTGKTSLSYSLKDTLKRQNGTFVRGKYDVKLKEQPLSGIGNVCNELCREVLYKREPELMEKIRNELLENIDTPLLDVLETLIPLLSVLLTTKGFPMLPTVAETVSPPRRTTSSATSSDVSSMKSEEERSWAGKKNDQKSKNNIARYINFANRRMKVNDSSHSGSSFPSQDNSTRQRKRIDPSQSKQLIQFAIRTFLRTLASNVGPIVAVFDDLQWADISSLEMLKVVISDASIPNFMIIACYRSDEIDTTHILSKMIRDIRSGAAETSGSNLTEIEVRNLSVESVNEMIAELLSVSTEKAMELSSICHKRTLGNVFFVKVFLMMLHDMEILEFNIGTFQWTWSVEKVEKETAATDNVVSMIKMKMDRYPDGMLLFLSLAARLGSTFETSTVELLWDFFEDKYLGTLEEVDVLLEVAMREMLIEHAGGTSYRFVHDKIQETAMQLIPEEEYDEFRTDMGKVLYENLPEDELETMIFVLADLLNDGLYGGIEMAILNSRAATKARELSAFQSAIHYVESGIMSLNDVDMWMEHRDLSLQLYSAGAEAEECAGHSEKSEWYCKEVMRKDSISVVGKMRVIKLTLERLYSNGTYDDLWATCLDTLSELGCTLPRRKIFQRIQAAMSIHQIKQYLPLASEVEKMDIMKGSAKRESMSLMVKAASFCLGSNNKPLYKLLCCRCVQWTKKYGLTEYTASAFASLANVLMHEYNDWRTGMRVAEIALSIEARIGSNYTKTSTLHKLNSFVLGWVKPLRSCRTNYLEAYKVGMLSGNIEGVGMTILFFLMSEFFSGGHKLQGLDEDLRNYIPQLEKLKLHSYVLGLRLLWQKVLNLMGAPYNPQTIDLKGTAMHGIDIERHPFIYNTVGRHHICNLCAYFAEYEKGAKVALDMDDVFYKTWSGAAYFGFEPFPRGLCLYAMANETRQTKYLSAAQKVRSNMSKWVRSGAINLVHQLLILDAENEAAKGNEHLARKAYGKAIAASVRGGFLQDAGIANERYAIYLLSIGWDGDDACFYIKEAVRYFSEWGASRKVEHLKEKHANLLTGFLGDAHAD